MNIQFSTPFGQYQLKRIPEHDKSLQAWESADSYLLQHLADLLHQKNLDLNQSKILILNDSFGGLTVPLAQFGCDCYSDSFVSHLAIKRNLEMNKCSMDKVSFIKSTDKLDGQYDIVLFKLVKTKSFFQEQMTRLLNHISPGIQIIGAVMAKNLQKTWISFLGDLFGDAQASLAWKKARLIHVDYQTQDKSLDSETPPRIYKFSLSTHEIIYGLTNVFSKDKLDIGTRFFLEHFPGPMDLSKESCQQIVDLGCGNGVLALKAAQQFTDATITCIDESYMAVDSAKMTLQANLDVQQRKLFFVAGDGLSEIAANSIDLILCNPPFHQQFVVGDAIAWQLFKQAKRCLMKGGELWIVGNRHLAYHVKLKKIFANQTLVASNRKFVILKAIKS